MEDTPTTPTPASGDKPSDKDLREELAAQKAIVLSQQRGFKIGDDVGHKYGSRLYNIKSIVGERAIIKPVFPGVDPTEPTVPLDELYHIDIFEEQMRLL